MFELWRYFFSEIVSLTLKKIYIIEQIGQIVICLTINQLYKYCIYLFTAYNESYLNN